MTGKLVEKNLNKNGPQHGTQNQKVQKIKGVGWGKPQKIRGKEGSRHKRKFSTKSCTKHQKREKYIYIYI